MANEYFYPWYPAHYRRDAGHLDHLSDSCYRRLIDAYMEGGEPIKKDPIRLMAIMRVSPEQFALVWPQIENFFVLSTDGFLHHKRCNIELDRQIRFMRRQSEAGKRSASKRSQQLQLLTNHGSTTVQPRSRTMVQNHGSTTVDVNELGKSTAYQPPFNGGSTSVEETGHKIREEHKNDAGASGGPSARQMLFTACLTWLAALNGKDPSKYRSLIGQWLRDYGEIKTLQAFVEAQKENPQGDRAAYMARLLKPKPQQRTQDVGL